MSLWNQFCALVLLERKGYKLGMCVCIYCHTYYHYYPFKIVYKVLCFLAATLTLLLSPVFSQCSLSPYKGCEVEGLGVPLISKWLLRCLMVNKCIFCTLCKIESWQQMKIWYIKFISMMEKKIFGWPYVCWHHLVSPHLDNKCCLMVVAKNSKMIPVHYTM